MKTCSKCQETKPMTEFTWRADTRYSKGGYHASRCKVCMSNYAKDYQRENQAQCYANQKAWREANRERWNAIVLPVTRRRAAAKLQRVPPWYDHAKAREVYALAAEFREAGFKVDVDHIIPLQGEIASGLHWHGNLRVCLAGHNRSKRNEMPRYHGALATPEQQFV